MKFCLCKKLTTPTICTLVGLGLIVLFVIIHETIGILKFFEEYRHVLTAIYYFAVAFGVFLAYAQIKGAKKQAKARFAYEMIKDGDDVTNSINPNILHLILETECSIKIDNNTRNEIDRSIAKILRWYASVYIQRKHYKNVDDDQWELTKDTFSFLLNKYFISEYWERKVAPGKLWPSVFKKMREECLHQ